MLPFVKSMALLPPGKMLSLSLQSHDKLPAGPSGALPETTLHQRSEGGRVMGGVADKEAWKHFPGDSEMLGLSLQGSLSVISLPPSLPLWTQQAPLGPGVCSLHSTGAGGLWWRPPITQQMNLRPPSPG